MNNKYIDNIHIKRFKCFNNLKIEGLKRVNLISGKNNVGKTAFLEACFLGSNAFYMFTKFRYKKFIDVGFDYHIYQDKSWYNFEFIKLLLIIKQNRERSSFFTHWLREEVELTSFSDFTIRINNICRLNLLGDSLSLNFLRSPLVFNEIPIPYQGEEGEINISKFIENKHYYKIYKKNHLPIIGNTTFVSICDDSTIQEMIDDLKLNASYSKINDYLTDIFQIDKVDVIKNKVMLQQNNEYKNLNEFGDGIRHFLNIALVLLSNKETTIYLDEVDNGIHYSLFDKLWEIILNTSKKQNIQIFATTHSQECIESYNRITKELKDDDITFLELFRHRDDIKSTLLDSSMLDYQLDQHHEVRG